MGERVVDDDEVGGSIPPPPTNFCFWDIRRFGWGSDRIFPEVVKKSPDHIWVTHAKDGWRRR